jgi:SCP-2 sterol transfer family
VSKGKGKDKGARRARPAPASGAGAQFLEELARRGHDPRLVKARGTLRFDIADGKRTEHWLIALDRGNVAVSRRKGAADCVARIDKATFDEVGSGLANPISAFLRGAMTSEGDIELLVIFQRVLPAPPRGRP